MRGSPRRHGRRPRARREPRPPPGRPMPRRGRLLIFPCNGNGLEALDCLGDAFRCIGFIDDRPRACPRRCTACRCSAAGRWPSIPRPSRSRCPAAPRATPAGPR
ncbi:MAG: hypothetical protein MZU95_07475 [Desulfomicrobium escambiense]|nr:hypothetical protein [Desulfomicrobium escambiense]